LLFGVYSVYLGPASGVRIMPSSSTTASLRALLVDRYPGAVLLPEQSTPPAPTGIAAIDRILPNGGLPRGRVVTWQAPTGGATAILRAACHERLAQGERAAWIDGLHTLGSHWIDGPLVLRPRSPELARKAAEILLRSGGFGLVVISGAPLDHGDMLRLSRMVHEGGGAFVALTSQRLAASLRITSRYLLERFSWSPGPFLWPARVDRVGLEIGAKAPGWNAHTVLELPLDSHDLRFALEPGLADRRGLLD